MDSGCQKRDSDQWQYITLSRPTDTLSKREGNVPAGVTSQEKIVDDIMLILIADKEFLLVVK